MGLLESVGLPGGGGPLLRWALAAADAALPGARIERLPVRLGAAPGYRWEADRGLWVELSPGAEHPGLSLLHELGHAVDHQVLGWGSERDALAGWWRALTSTQAFRSLCAACPADELGYWAARRECFARSFAQWVAERAGDLTLRAEIARRAAGAGRQWRAADFAPVRAELDVVLAAL